MMQKNKIINKVSHLGIYTPDRKHAVDFYENVLGFGAGDTKIVLDGQEGALEVTFLQLGDCTLELFHKTADSGQNRESGVFDHYALAAPDFALCARKARNLGAILHSSTPDGEVMYDTVGPKGVRGINFCGPSKEVIELCHDYFVDYGNKRELSGWSHLALKVRNLKRSLEFYSSLGFNCYSKGYLDTPEEKLMIGMIEFKGFTMELIQTCQADLLHEKAGSIDHIAFEVSDVAACLSYIKTTGWQLLTPIVHELSLGKNGIRYIMIAGPDGERIELTENR